jgi:CRP-like cAMP-binding protein
LIFNLFKSLSKTNAGLVRKIDAISRTTIREKILAYLGEELEYANRANHTPDNHRITIPMNKTEMAQYLCVHRSALLREIAAMRQDGLISVNGQTFTIFE